MQAQVGKEADGFPEQSANLWITPDYHSFIADTTVDILSPMTFIARVSNDQSDLRLSGAVLEKHHSLCILLLSRIVSFWDCAEVNWAWLPLH